MSTAAHNVPAAGPANRPRRTWSRPEISLLLSTYQKPLHLRRVLASIAMQQGVGGAMELVVTDDGSTDETHALVRRFARDVSFRVELTTHEHEGFQLSRCRNEGAAAARAPYLLFLDGDCLIPPDHVAQHLRRRRPQTVMAGYCCRLDRATSERIDEPAVRSARYLDSIPPGELRSLALRDWKARFYSLLRHPSKPKMAGGNVGIWREDYERVNGYDEKFQGWGGEDDDLRRRLARARVRVASILRWTHTCHLWHPSEPSAPERISEGRNFHYLSRRGTLTRCRRGLVERGWHDLDVRLTGSPADPQRAARCLGRPLPAPVEAGRACEIELLFFPGAGSFTRRSECRLLAVLGNADPPARLTRQADVILSDQPLAVLPGQRLYRWSAVEQALREAG